jgi:hypothetical protein
MVSTRPVGAVGERVRLVVVEKVRYVCITSATDYTWGWTQAFAHAALPPTEQLFVELELDSSCRLSGVFDCIHGDNLSRHPVSCIPGMTVLLRFSVIM